MDGRAALLCNENEILVLESDEMHFFFMGFTTGWAGYVHISTIFITQRNGD
jgi:hypothetical protein